MCYSMPPFAIKQITSKAKRTKSFLQHKLHNCTSRQRSNLWAPHTKKDINMVERTPWYKQWTWGPGDPWASWKLIHFTTCTRYFCYIVVLHSQAHHDVVYQLVALKSWVHLYAIHMLSKDHTSLLLHLSNSTGKGTAYNIIPELHTEVENFFTIHTK